MCPCHGSGVGSRWSRSPSNPNDSMMIPWFTYLSEKRKHNFYYFFSWRLMKFLLTFKNCIDLRRLLLYWHIDFFCFPKRSNEKQENVGALNIKTIFVKQQKMSYWKYASFFLLSLYIKFKLERLFCLLHWVFFSFCAVLENYHLRYQ